MNLLHPQLSSRRAQMVVYFESTKVNVKSCKAVMSYVRGHLKYATLHDFLMASPITKCSEGGLDMLINGHALIWHNQSIEHLQSAIKRLCPDAQLNIDCDNTNPVLFSWLAVFFFLYPTSQHTVRQENNQPKVRSPRTADFFSSFGRWTPNRSKSISAYRI